MKTGYTVRIEYRSGLWLFCSHDQRKALGLTIGVEEKHFRWRWRARLCAFSSNWFQPPPLLGQFHATVRPRLMLVHDSTKAAA